MNAPHPAVLFIESRVLDFFRFIAEEVKPHGEAWEEAGVKGRIEQNHFGHYLDTKRTLGPDSLAREVRIAAFLLEVHSTENPQESGRNPSWFSAQQARKRLAEGRQAPYSRHIAKMIDAALDQLTAKSRKQTEILLRVQGRRRLASAR